MLDSYDSFLILSFVFNEGNLSYYFSYRLKCYWESKLYPKRQHVFIFCKDKAIDSISNDYYSEQ
jgi:hypothetical protein